MDFTNQNLTRKAYLQNSPRNEQGPNLYLETETSFRQDMITTSFDEQWAKPISRAKARSLSNEASNPEAFSFPNFAQNRARQRTLWRSV